MEVKLSVEILQMAVTVDEAGQNGFALDVDHLGARRNSEFAAPAYRGELSSVNNDRRIVDSRPAGAIDQLVREGKIGIIHTRPLDLSIDEVLDHRPGGAPPDAAAPWPKVTGLVTRVSPGVGSSPYAKSRLSHTSTR